MRSQLSTALLAATFALVRAIQVTSPTKDQVADAAQDLTVQWVRAGGDPQHAHLELVNMAGGHTPFNKDFGEVDLTKGSFSISLKDVPSDTAYQVNIKSVEPMNSGILAQSAQFTVKNGGGSAALSGPGSDSGSSSSSSSSSSPAGAATPAPGTGSGSDSTAPGTGGAAGAGGAAGGSGATPPSGGSGAGAAGGSAGSVPTPTPVFPGNNNGTRPGAPSSTPTAGASLGKAVQAGNLLAFLAGVAAVIA